MSRHYHLSYKRKHGVDSVPLHRTIPHYGRMRKNRKRRIVIKNHVIFGNIRPWYPVVVVYEPCVMIVVLRRYLKKKLLPPTNRDTRCTCHRKKTEQHHHHTHHRTQSSLKITTTLMTLMIWVIPVPSGPVIVMGYGWIDKIRRGRWCVVLFGYWYRIVYLPLHYWRTTRASRSITVPFIVSWPYWPWRRISKHPSPIRGVSPRVLYRPCNNDRRIIATNIITNCPCVPNVKRINHPVVIIVGSVIGVYHIWTITVPGWIIVSVRGIWSISCYSYATPGYVQYYLCHSLGTITSFAVHHPACIILY